MRRMIVRLLTGLSVSGLLSLSAAAQSAPAARRAASDPPEVLRFLARAEREMATLTVKAQQAEWVAETYITDDTEKLTAEAQRVAGVAAQRYAVDASRYLRTPDRYSPTVRRKLEQLRLLVPAPPPADSAKAAELTTLVAQLTGEYGRGSWCRTRAGTRECLQISDISRIMATSRDPQELLETWTGWHAIGAPMRARYARFVTLSNEGARSIGFADAGALWRSNYDMEPAAFEQEVDRLWQQLQPLYLQLHSYVRWKLVEKYGAKVVPPTGPIPAHLLGNLWAQEWSNIYDLVAPTGTAANDVDITALLKAKQVDALGMVRYGEGFFTSLGFPKLPETFWARSQFTKPRDRDVVCHASAWDIDAKEDLRIKMCIEPTAEDFVTIHHELGHNFYQRAYNRQPFLFQNGANGGFHEAIGDAIALSITPAYLKQIGLLTGPEPGVDGDIPMLLRKALEKVAFLPWGLLLDKWRWQVFDGRTAASRYEADFWQLRRQYQGVSAPVARTETDFSPGAKFHVASNTPYSIYFVAAVLQFQFYRSLCKSAGYTGPIHRCSFYGNAAAGKQFATMLEAGASRPWQETLRAMTGESRMDAGAMAEYFAPLQRWLEMQNRGKPIGW